MDTKIKLREIYKEKRDSLHPDTLLSGSHLIQQRLFQCEEYRRAETLFVYLSMASEVQTAPVIEYGWICGKRVAVPVVMKNRQLCFVEIDDWNGLKRSRHGILEPRPDRVIAGDENTLVIVPGLVFSVHKYRIGYGGGYYDRFFASHAVGCKIGIAFDFQVLPDIPVEPYDISVDKIITEKRAII